MEHHSIPTEGTDNLLYLVECVASPAPFLDAHIFEFRHLMTDEGGPTELRGSRLGGLLYGACRILYLVDKEDREP